MKKVAIIGASAFQAPLILKAKELGIETHVFAWKVGDVGETLADSFYPISIVKKEEILKVCQQIGVDGICSIGSDLAMITVNYVADQMSLNGNSIAATAKSTNKHLMRLAFEKRGDPSPISIEVTDCSELKVANLRYPVIVKPTDRSGSRGVSRVDSKEGLNTAINNAFEQSFEKRVLVEEFVRGKEYSVEYISFHGKHFFITVTEKFTTGAPHFIETGHIEPAALSYSMLDRIKQVVEHALDSLELKNGAAHAEIRIEGDSIHIIEIGGRMGGDFIGSHLVQLTTGYDYVKAVLMVALGEQPEKPKNNSGKRSAAIRFIFKEEDAEALRRLYSEHPEYLIDYEIKLSEDDITDSSNRQGYYMFTAETREKVLPYMPSEDGDN